LRIEEKRREGKLSGTIDALKLEAHFSFVKGVELIDAVGGPIFWMHLASSRLVASSCGITCTAAAGI